MSEEQKVAAGPAASLQEKTSKQEDGIPSDQQAHQKRPAASQRPSSSSWQHPQQRRRRTRPKPLLVPIDGLSAEQEDDAYECNAESFLDASLWRTPRPWASMGALATQPSTDHSATKPQQQQYAERGLAMPILQDFFRSLRADDSKQDNLNNGETMAMPYQAPGAADGEEGRDSSGAIAVQLEAIDDPNSSTLTVGQHVRYRQLQDELKSDRATSWNESKRKEHKRLCTMMKHEQGLYLQALEAFFEHHKDRFLVGFHKEQQVGGSPASLMARFNAKLVAHYKEQWNSSSETSMGFGKCTQSISLQNVSREVVVTARNRNLRRRRGGDKTKLSIDSISSTIVHTSQLTDKFASVDAAIWTRDETRTSSLSLATACSKVDESALVTTSSSHLIRDDTVALKLAREHGVDIVTTYETMDSLLQLPGDEVTRWMIPVCTEESLQKTEASATTTTDGQRSKEKKMLDDHHPIVILDLPIPQPSTPRDCLARGFEAALYEGVSSFSPPQADDAGDSASLTQEIQCVYTLLTLPSLGGGCRGRRSKVLVRSWNRLKDKNQHQPVRLHAQLEYFPERGWEELTSHQKSLWILDKILQPNCRVVLGRICPQTAQLLQLEEVSAAHALAGDDSSPDGELDSATGGGGGVDPMDHWQAMVELMHSIVKTMERGEQLLCLPGRQVPSSSSAACSVSVHKVDTKEAVDGVGSSGTICLEKEFQEADAVYMGPSVLRHCFQGWKWEEERTPFTFPIKQNDRMATG